MGYGNRTACSGPRGCGERLGCSAAMGFDHPVGCGYFHGSAWRLGPVRPACRCVLMLPGAPPSPLRPHAPLSGAHVASSGAMNSDEVLHWGLVIPYSCEGLGGGPQRAAHRLRAALRHHNIGAANLRPRAPQAPPCGRLSWTPCSMISSTILRGAASRRSEGARRRWHMDPAVLAILAVLVAGSGGGSSPSRSGAPHSESCHTLAPFRLAPVRKS